MFRMKLSPVLLTPKTDWKEEHSSPLSTVSPTLWAWIERAGRFFVAIAMAGFGIQHFIYQGTIEGLEILPRWLPAHTLWGYVTGVVLIVAAVCIVTRRFAWIAATVLADIFLLTLIFRDGPTMAAIGPDLRERTRVFETLTMCGGCFLLAAAAPVAGLRSQRWVSATRVAGEVGRIAFAVSMAVFGWSHILIPAFIASLIPAWIPWHFFWVYATAFVFFAAAISIAVKRFTVVTAGMLGLMLCLWVVVLHGPRVAAALHNGDEWNSLFVALAIGGFGLAIAGVSGARSGEQGWRRGTE